MYGCMFAHCCFALVLVLKAVLQWGADWWLVITFNWEMACSQQRQKAFEIEAPL